MSSPSDKSASNSQQEGDKPKPCCVCKPEKEARDTCLLFNGQDSGKCDELIGKYKKCMQSYGFTV
ncbi:LAME_0C03026g1_1 [Lachancea meyersii CBS 8951]|uniref:LAME_0C03026g1_1 n=1 Tax=Lachancea meyersii CBS 8951 TaxID=1266667 RepID=A0A1G4J085_9SACH|nr:LAME_0C03026g1_1 [Lachancea meyersii CBS 8951]